jgi:hypothetical protein
MTADGERYPDILKEAAGADSAVAEAANLDGQQTARREERRDVLRHQYPRGVDGGRDQGRRNANRLLRGQKRTHATSFQMTT